MLTFVLYFVLLIELLRVRKKGFYLVSNTHSIVKFNCRN